MSGTGVMDERLAIPAHYKIAVYEECVAHPEPDDCEPEWEAWSEAHFYVGEDGVPACEDSRVSDVCGPCSKARQERENDDVWVDWPCGGGTGVDIREADPPRHNFGA
jgi:hypothetical protein